MVNAANKFGSTIRLINNQQSRSSRMCLIFCLIITGLFAFAAPVYAEIYYLDPVNGKNDTNGHDGSSQKLAWKTIVYAEENADKGSTVYLMTGNYGVVHIIQQNVKRSSWRDALTFKPDRGASPIIEQLFIEALTTTTSIDRYLIFDGLTFKYPDQSNADITRNTDIVSSESDRYLKFLNCTVSSNLGVDTEGHYWEQKSIQDCVQLGRARYAGINNITIDNCNIQGAGQCGVRVQGTTTGDIAITNNKIHKAGHAGVKVEGTSLNEILIKGNEIYDELPVWNSDHRTIHHTSSIYIACNNVNVRGNIIRGGGSTNPITTYQEIMDGGVYLKRGKLDNPEHPFTVGEAVTQKVTGAKGWVNRGGQPKRDYLRIYRNQEKNLFDAEHDVVSDANSKVVYHPGMFSYKPRSFGGYQNITIENNLIYDSRQKFYCNNFQDIGANFKFNNNTIIGCHLTGKYNYKGVSYYKNAFRLNYSPAGYDSSTVQICNNIFAGYFSASFYKGDETIVGNIFFAFFLDRYKDQAWVNNNLPGNKVYNWNKGDKTTGLSALNTSDSFFVGGPSFDKYHAGRSTIWYGDNWPHQQDLGHSYALSSNSHAVSYANSDYATETDILGNARDATPDAGCYEYVSSDNDEEPIPE